jgi:N-acetylneuraminic acid mutarotase
MKLMKNIQRRGAIAALLLIIVFLLPKESNAGWVHTLTVNLTNADWTLVGEDNGDWTGYFASPAGDVNGDGLGDILVGAPMAGEKVCPYPLNPDGTCPGLPKGKGVAYLVLGRKGEMAPDPLNLESADASFLGCETTSMTARQLYAAGDVNGDGYDDILISGWKCGENFRGKAYLFLGRPDVETWGRFYPVEQADASFLGENEWDFLSYYVSTAGDVNADGYDDMLITSTHHEYDEPCPPGAPEDCTNCCKSFEDSAEFYEMESDSWVLTGNLNVDRMNHASIPLNGKVLTTGGQNANHYLASAELYDPAEGNWVLTGNLNTARSDHSLTSLSNGKALAAGGQNANGFLASAELYDPAEGIWTDTSEMNNARSAHTATLLPNGKVLVVGGENAAGFLDTAELYDPANGEWESAGNLNNARSNHTATLLTDGKVVVVGGENAFGFLNSSELYDPVSGTWTDFGILNIGRSNHTATFMPDENLLLVAGGQDASGALYSSEVLDPISGTWNTTSELRQPRENHTATLLPDGRVMVIGGLNNGGSVSSYEFYDPISATWTFEAIKSLHYARANHTATIMQDGRVLVSGGRNCADFGKVYLILGRKEADWGTDFDLALADASFLGEAVEDRIGRSATGVGDTNGDGYEDFLIGAKGSDYAAKDAGQNYLFLGRATEDDPNYDSSRPWWGNDYSVSGADASFVGEAAGDETGRRVAWAGDVNGDGLDDMLMQSALNDHSYLDAGITYVVLGRKEADWGMHFSLTNADASFVGENKRDQSGRRMSGAGDVNNDGYDDFITGAPHNEDGSEYQGIAAGKSYLIYGRPEADWGRYVPLSRADVILVGKPEIGFAGYDNAWLNDFNGDGIDDYLVAAYGGRNNDHVPGEVYVVLGSDKPLATQFLPDTLFRSTGELPFRFASDFWEPNGWQDFNILELILEDTDTSGESLGFKVRYDQVNNALYLFDDSKGDWLGPCTPQVNGVLTNDVVSLVCKGSRVSNDDNRALRVMWNIEWVKTRESGQKFNVYLRATDRSGNDTGLVKFGTWPIAARNFYLPQLMK